MIDSDQIKTQKNLCLYYDLTTLMKQAGAELCQAYDKLRLVGLLVDFYFD